MCRWLCMIVKCFNYSQALLWWSRKKLFQFTSLYPIVCYTCVVYIEVQLYIPTKGFEEQMNLMNNHGKWEHTYDHVKVFNKRIILKRKTNWFNMKNETDCSVQGIVLWNDWDRERTLPCASTYCVLSSRPCLKGCDIQWRSNLFKYLFFPHAITTWKNMSKTVTDCGSKGILHALPCYIAV